METIATSESMSFGLWRQSRIIQTLGGHVFDLFTHKASCSDLSILHWTTRITFCPEETFGPTHTKKINGHCSSEFSSVGLQNIFSVVHFQFCSRRFLQKNQEIEELLTQLEEDTGTVTSGPGRGGTEVFPAHRTVRALRGNGSLSRQRCASGTLPSLHFLDEAFSPSIRVLFSQPSPGETKWSPSVSKTVSPNIRTFTPLETDRVSSNF